MEMKIPSVARTTPEQCEKISKAPSVWYWFGTPQNKRGFFFLRLNCHRIVWWMQWNTKANLSCLSIETHCNITLVFNPKCDFLITMDYLFQKCILINTVGQELGVKLVRGGWWGCCFSLGLGIFSCQRWRRGWISQGQGLENFSFPFRWVEIFIGFATT